MIYAGDEYVPLPTKDLYDTQMMMAAISAVKDRYDKTQEALDKYADKYSDFSSPVYGANQAFYDVTQGRMQKIIDDLYSQGIDPLRSSAGISQIMRGIRSTDVIKANQLKQ